MNGRFLGGIAVGIGIGWLNATALSLPVWMNIVIMVALAMMGRMIDESAGVKHGFER